jgi:hypothetical protein
MVGADGTPPEAIVVFTEFFWQENPHRFMAALQLNRLAEPYVVSQDR